MPFGGWFQRNRGKDLGIWESSCGALLHKLEGVGELSAAPGGERGIQERMGGRARFLRSGWMQ